MTSGPAPRLPLGAVDGDHGEMAAWATTDTLSTPQNRQPPLGHGTGTGGACLAARSASTARPSPVRPRARPT